MTESQLGNEALDYGTGIGFPQADAQIQKALEAHEGVTDIGNLTGGGALQRHSLEDNLALLAPQLKHLSIWSDLHKSSAKSTLEEYTTQDGYGSSDSAFTSQLGLPENISGDYNRQFAVTKYLRSVWQVADVLTATQTLVGAEMVEKQAALIRVLRAFNTGLYNGDEDVLPVQVNGLEKTAKTQGGANVIDLNGGNPTIDVLNQAAESIFTGFGMVNTSKLFVSPGVNTAISAIVRQAEGAGGQNQRVVTVQGAEGIKLGQAVTGIQTPYGEVKIRPDMFLGAAYEAHGVPTVRNNARQIVEGSTHSKAPVTPAVAVAAANAAVPNSKWGDSTRTVRGIGAYRYRVYAFNASGRSAASAVSSAVNVVADRGAVITITNNASDPNPATGYAILGEAAVGSGRYALITRVARSSGATTVFTDINEDIPGTGKAFMLDVTGTGPGRTVSIAQLISPYSQQLAKIGPYNWGYVTMAPALKYYAPERIVMIKNIGVTNTRVSANLDK